MVIVAVLAAVSLGGAALAGVQDIHSYARPYEVRVVHMELDLDVRFDRKVLEGSVVLQLERGPAGAGAPLRLDTRDLSIGKVTAGTAGLMKPTTFKLGPVDPILGSELLIELPAGADRVAIEYKTSPEASGLQWVDPEQTAGGKHPFLYSQSQAIHGRTWIPCQDSPGVRVTFKATVRVGAPLKAVMAARTVESSGKPGQYSFDMPYPIPAYLIALAAGDLVFGATGPRTGVWAEPSLLSASVYEFADTEKMLVAAEKTYGPYRWGRYDLLVLPPSFPYGGMENPMLTFATPTILAGDRSLVALVAHEMAHSWSGNLVTNATWSDFWLNEGFTTYFERRLMETVYGRERSEMEWMLGRQDLDKELAGLADKPADQALHINLTGRDPEDGSNDIPYEKGALLLRLLEEKYGREKFDAFLRAWFDEHAFTSVTTRQFMDFLGARLMAAGSGSPELTEWLDGAGVPASAPVAKSDALARVDAQVALFVAGSKKTGDLATSGWTFHEWLHFLRALPAKMSVEQMTDLDSAFGFTKTGNSEILDEWLVLGIRHDYRIIDKRLEEFLMSVGRRKFLKPLYQELVLTEAGKAKAMAIYTKARPRYQAIARKTIDEIVGWK